jgi:hypothetical protein
MEKAIKNKGALWITTTAVFIALLIGVQLATAPLSQFVTGPLVNMILIVSVMTCGLSSGMTVAFLSPVFAKLLGIGPLWTIIPFIMIGNIVLVLIWHTVSRMSFNNEYLARIVTLITAAVSKFLVLYFGIVKIMIPLFLNLPEKQAAVISNIFSIPQLFTAFIGGALAIGILPVIEKIRAKKE